MRRLDPDAYVGNQVHEVHPVKFAGDPTALSNKMVTPTELHQQYTTWWSKLQTDLGF